MIRINSKLPPPKSAIIPFLIGTLLTKPKAANSASSFFVNIRIFEERIFSAGKINSLLFFEFLTAAVATGTICFTSIFLMIIENRCKAFNALEIDLVDNFPVSNNFSPNLQLILSLKRG